MNLLLFIAIISQSNYLTQQNRLWAKYDSLLNAGDSAGALRVAEQILKIRHDKNAFISLYARAQNRKMPELGILILKKGREILGQPYAFSAQLYTYATKIGDFETALYELMNMAYERGYPEPQKWMYSQAESFAKRMGFSKTLKILNKWSKDHPKSRIATYIGIKLLLKERNLDEALKFAKEHRAGCLEVAQTAYRADDWDVVMDALELVNPEDTASAENKALWHYLMAEASLNRGDTAEAINHLELASALGEEKARKKLIHLFLLKNETDSARSYALFKVERATIAIFNGDYEQAVEELQPIERPKEKYLYGLCLALEGKADSAKAVLKQIVMENPEGKEANDALRLMLILTKSKNEDCKNKFLEVEKLSLFGFYTKCANKLMRLANKCPELRDFAYLRAGEYFERSGDIGNAFGAYGQVKGDLRPMALFKIFKIAIDLGQSDIAKKSYDELIEKFSQSPFAEMARSALPAGGFE